MSHKPVDLYYLKLANEVKSFFDTAYYLPIRDVMSVEEATGFCCFLTSYFEDIISGTNIWTTFMNKYGEMYQKQLPFFETSEYYENEINDADVAFLSWYYLNMVNVDDFFPPHNPIYMAFAGRVMAIFDKEYEYALENEQLKACYKIDEGETEYYVYRNLINTVLTKTYLFYPDTALDFIYGENEIIKEEEDVEFKFTMLQETWETFLSESCTRLLSLKGKEWAAEILGKEHPGYFDLLNMSQRISGLFLYKGQDGKNVFLEHIASGKRFDLSKKSYEHSDNLKEIDTMVFMGIVRWMDEWWFSGLSNQMEYDDALFLKEKKSIYSKKQVGFLDYETKAVKDQIAAQYRAFLEFNDGAQIAFIPSDQVDGFIKKYTDYFNSNLDYTQEEIDRADEQAKKSGFFGDRSDEDAQPDFADDPGPYLIFFNPKSGIELAYGIISAFPLKNNPYYKVEESDEDVKSLLDSHDFSKELVQFCFDNCKDDLPFFKEEENNKLMEDIDFLLRFWKGRDYHTVPEITLTGEAVNSEQ